jgi:hypothetical protein
VNPVAFHINGYGDRLLVLPAMRALGELFRGSLRLLCARGDGETFYGDVQSEQVIEIAAERQAEGWAFDPAAVAARLGDCDLFLTLHPWENTDSTNLLRTLGPDRVERVRNDGETHAVDASFAVAQRFDPQLRVEDFSRVPSFGRAAQDAAGEILAHVPKSRRILAVHTETDVEKSWPVEDFVRILDAFLDTRSDWICLVVDKARPGIDAGRHGASVVACERLPLPVAMTLVARASLFLGVDSCMLHVADLARVPGLAMFRTTSPARFGYRFAGGENVCAPARLSETDIRTIAARLAAFMP